MEQARTHEYEFEMVYVCSIARCHCRLDYVRCAFAAIFSSLWRNCYIKPEYLITVKKCVKWDLN